MSGAAGWAAVVAMRSGPDRDAEAERPGVLVGALLRVLLGPRHGPGAPLHVGRRVHGRALPEAGRDRPPRAPGATDGEVADTDL